MDKPLKKIILTDDDADILTIAQFSLETMTDVEIKYCHSGQHAVQEALNFVPDLMILDVMMPQMDGMDTMHAIRLLPSIAHIPIIFLTAKIQKNEIENYLKKGAISVISKPFDPLKLGSQIKNCWESYTPHDKVVSF